MTRTQFFLVAAVVPGVFGLVMMLAPGMMLKSSLTEPAHATATTVTRWVGFAVFSIACITFLSRTDPGSDALRAVMIGNIVFHLLGIVMDTYGFLARTMTASGLVTGLVPHTALAIGFAYYLNAM
jgi:hypothetical protein